MVAAVASRYDAVFLDFYGTLVTGDRQAVERTCAKVVADHDLPLTPSQLAERWGRNFFAEIERCNDDAFASLFDCECVSLVETLGDQIADFDPTPYAMMLREYWNDPPLADGVLDGLLAIDLPVYIVSNADTADVQEAMRRRGIQASGVVTSEDARSYKPHAGIFKAALSLAGVSADRVIHVGDSLHSDVSGAQAMGMTACWVCYSDRILDIGDAAPCHKILSLKDLPAILANGSF